MIPASADNCEENYCSILCLKTTPGVLCISQNSGTVFHCLILPSGGDIDAAYVSCFWQPSKNIFNALYSLFSSSRTISVLLKQLVEICTFLNRSSWNLALQWPRKKTYLVPYFCTEMNQILADILPLTIQGFIQLLFRLLTTYRSLSTPKMVRVRTVVKQVVFETV